MVAELTANIERTDVGCRAVVHAERLAVIVDHLAIAEPLLERRGLRHVGRCRTSATRTGCRALRPHRRRCRSRRLHRALRSRPRAWRAARLGAFCGALEEPLLIAFSKRRCFAASFGSLDCLLSSTCTTRFSESLELVGVSAFAEDVAVEPSPEEGGEVGGGVDELIGERLVLDDVLGGAVDARRLVQSLRPATRLSPGPRPASRSPS
jgi:hypothetical protein